MHGKFQLLNRDAFRAAVFNRDRGGCVVCGKPATAAHHIIERRLWDNGGYYLANGASLCDKCHIEAEKTLISVEDLRIKIGITSFPLPDHFYSDQVYDKWANPVLPNGQRIKGELFHDESVQKILKEGGVLSLFTNLVKYPRTYHLPWSEGMNDDDRMAKDLSWFIGKRVIVSMKMDGENSTLMRSCTHARSVDSQNHPSRNWLKNFWSRFNHEIPEGWRICGENLYAKHSIAYENLPSYFMGFSIWNEKNICLGWDETQVWFALLGITPVEVIYDGIYDEGAIKSLWVPKEWETKEGYVVRIADEFSYGDFRKNVAKFVRKGHVMTTKHWMHGQRIVKNGIIETSEQLIVSDKQPQ